MSLDLLPSVLQAKLLSILHRAFVQARNLALAGDCPQLAELADTFEVLPEMMRRWEATSAKRARDLLAEYEANHPHAGYSYVAILDMDDAEFLEVEHAPFPPFSSVPGVDSPNSNPTPPAHA